MVVSSEDEAGWEEERAAEVAVEEGIRGRVLVVVEEGREAPSMGGDLMAYPIDAREEGQLKSTTIHAPTTRPQTFGSRLGATHSIDGAILLFPLTSALPTTLDTLRISSSSSSTPTRSAAGQRISSFSPSPAEGRFGRCFGVGRGGGCAPTEEGRFTSRRSCIRIQRRARRRRRG